MSTIADKFTPRFQSGMNNIREQVNRIVTEREYYKKKYELALIEIKLLREQLQAEEPVIVQPIATEETNSSFGNLLNSFDTTPPEEIIQVTKKVKRRPRYITECASCGKRYKHDSNECPLLPWWKEGKLL